MARRLKNNAKLITNNINESKNDFMITNNKQGSRPARSLYSQRTPQERLRCLFIRSEEVIRRGDAESLGRIDKRIKHVIDEGVSEGELLALIHERFHQRRAEAEQADGALQPAIEHPNLHEYMEKTPKVYHLMLQIRTDE